MQSRMGAFHPFLARILSIIVIFSLLSGPRNVYGRFFSAMEGDEEIAVRMRPSQKGKANADVADSLLPGGFPGDSFIVKRILKEVRGLSETHLSSKSNESSPSNSPPPPLPPKKSEDKNSTDVDSPNPSNSTDITSPKPQNSHYKLSNSHSPLLPTEEKQASKTKSSISILGPIAMAGFAAVSLTSIIAVGLCVYLCCKVSGNSNYKNADVKKKPSDTASPAVKGTVPFHVAELDDASGFTDISLRTPRSPKPDWGGKKGGKGWFTTLGWNASRELDSTTVSEAPEKGVDRDPSVPIHMYSYRDLQKATKNFTTQIGNGSNGPVYKALFSTGLEGVVKVMDKMVTRTEQDFQREVVNLGRLHHPHLVNLLGFCTDRGHKMLVYEYMANGALRARLQDQEKPTLKWAERVRILKEVAFGIHYLHDENQPAVLHRDVTTGNVLLDTDMSARVADFGLNTATSSEINAKHGGFKGPAGYVDPEFLLTGVFTEKSDVYSFGVLMFEVLAGRTPQQGLIEYINLATMGEEGKERWAILVDPRLEGRYVKEELTSIAMISHRCIRKTHRRRPKISEVVEALSHLGPSSVQASLPAALPLNKPIPGHRTSAGESTPFQSGIPIRNPQAAGATNLQSFASFQRTQSWGNSFGRSVAAAAAAASIDEESESREKTEDEAQPKLLERSRLSRSSTLGSVDFDSEAEKTDDK